MSIAEKYNSNKGPVFNYEFPEKGEAKYVTLKDMYSASKPDRVFGIYALFINTKGSYGPQPVVCSDGNLIFNFPVHMLEKIQDMRNDPEAVQAINDGKLGFKITTYQRKGSRSVNYSAEFVDM